jgi:hypothetical protein
LVGQVAETDPAQAEFAINGPRSPANLAAPFAANGELGLAIRFGDFGFLGHDLNLWQDLVAGSGFSGRPRRFTKRHTEHFQ